MLYYYIISYNYVYICMDIYIYIWIYVYIYMENNAGSKAFQRCYLHPMADPGNVALRCQTCFDKLPWKTPTSTIRKGSWEGSGCGTPSFQLSWWRQMSLENCGYGIVRIITSQVSSPWELQSRIASWISCISWIKADELHSHIHIWLVVWTPLKTMSQLGSLFPI